MPASATFGNSEGTVVRLVLPNGDIEVTNPGDPRLGQLGLSIKPHVAPPAPIYMSPLAFFDLFTPEEEDAIAEAATKYPQVLLWLTRASAAQVIDLSDVRVAMGLGHLVQLGLLSAERVRAIIS